MKFENEINNLKHLYRRLIYFYKIKFGMVRYNYWQCLERSKRMPDF